MRPARTRRARGAGGREAEGGQEHRRRPRYIPAAVRRAVWDRDGARCAYVSPGGTRCGATARLEFHHRVPFAEGGASTVENLALACALHNRMEAARWFDFVQAELETGPLRHTRDRARGRTRG
ncbi:MAG: HNH endonuclease [Acidobacteria bacterium]|nr:HNH endonuclease [Acidobacteriota bacterium]